jgi:hypothetical protein
MANPKAFDEVQREMTLACDDFGRANSKIRLFAADPAFDDYHIGLISDATVHLTDGRGHMETGTALLLELQ